jgi:hypothetical protein
MESKKIVKIIVGIIVVVVLVVLFASGAFQKKTTSSNGETPANTEGNASGTEISLEPSAPVKVTGGPLASVESPTLFYEIKIIGGEFFPSEVIIEEKGNVQVGVVATDATYDVSFPAPIEKYLLMKKGQAAVFGFDAGAIQAGTYQFSCRDKCPEGKKMEGRLVFK